MKLVLYGQTPSQKNNKIIAINRRTGKRFPMTNESTKAWQDDVAIQLKAYKGQAEGKVTIAYQFYVKDMRRRDVDNMVCTVNDALVKAGLIKDDSWLWLAIGAADAEIDKQNPRVELFIEQDWPL